RSPLSTLLSDPSDTLFPYTTLFRSYRSGQPIIAGVVRIALQSPLYVQSVFRVDRAALSEVNRVASYKRPRIRYIMRGRLYDATRSEEHTSELQSRENLVCRLLLEKK